MDITDQNTFGIHSMMGWTDDQVIQVAPQQPIPIPPGFMRGFDNNRYLLSWRFDDQVDKMYYHLRVKTTGWVGFGFAENAPNLMMDNDVVVAGFNNGAGYLFVSDHL